jgi:hypothetical protein
VTRGILAGLLIAVFRPIGRGDAFNPKDQGLSTRPTIAVQVVA